jgi:hypothetical protein
VRGRVRSTQPPELENVGDQCALIMNASRTLIRSSAHSHKAQPTRSISISFVAVCGETLQMPAASDQQALATIHSKNAH